MPMIDATYRTHGATCLAIGNFDGVHRGHAALLDTMRTHATLLGAEPSVLTFEPHPAAVLGRGAPPRLTSLARKEALLRTAGVENVFALGFDRSLAGMAAERFARDILFDHLSARAVFVGEGFRFDQGRAGNVAMLRELGATHGVEIAAVDLVSDEGLPISSSRVRNSLAEGDVQAASAWLGRPHCVAGTVVHGDALGRTLGYPTANLDALDAMLPGFGIYAVDVLQKEASKSEALGRGAMSIGVRPTVTGSNEVRAEVYVLDFEGDLYGKQLEVAFVGRIRGEEKFGSLEALKSAIARDVAAARTMRG